MMTESCEENNVTSLGKEIENKLVNTATLDNFPDLILLDIFSRLDFNDRCMCSRVCRRWRMLINDFTLKRTIIVKKFLQERRLLSLIKNHFTEYLEEFQLLKPEMCSRYLVPIRKACFWGLTKHSHKLKKLVLFSCVFQNVYVYELPSNITHLTIRDSEIFPSSFLGSKPHLSLPHLTCLDFGGCNNFITSEDLRSLQPLKSLKALYFEGCYRINNGGIEYLVEILPKLEILDVEGTDISNIGVEFIFDNCIRIKELFVGHTRISDPVLPRCHRGIMPKLSHLCIRDTQISSSGLNAIINHPLNKNAVTVEVDFSYSNEQLSDPRNPSVGEVNSNIIHFYVRTKNCCHYLSHKCFKSNIR